MPEIGTPPIPRAIAGQVGIYTKPQPRPPGVVWLALAERQPPQKTEQGAVIHEILAGIRREGGRPPVRQAAADADIVRDVLVHITGDSLRDVRDRALWAFGMALCMRRSELVALRVEDLCRAPEGFRVAIRRSKGDQKGKGQEIAVTKGRRIRPVQHLEAWLAA
jgi:integrase